MKTLLSRINERLLKMSSTFWVVSILVGALLVAMGNIYYNSARESENKIEMAKQAIALIEPELKRNIETSHALLYIIDKKMIFNYEPFETEAWFTVSKSSIIMGLETGTLSKLIRVYYLFNKANSIHAQISNKGIKQNGVRKSKSEDLFLCLDETTIEATKIALTLKEFSLPHGSNISEISDAVRIKEQQKVSKKENSKTIDSLGKNENAVDKTPTSTPILTLKNDNDVKSDPK